MTYFGIIISVLLAIATWLGLFGINLTIWQILIPFFVMLAIDAILVLLFGGIATLFMRKR